MAFDRKHLRLYAITDRKWAHGRTIGEMVESALKGGATCIQLREKDLEETDLIVEAAELRNLCTKYGVPLIIDDNIEAALKSDADGVHIGQNDIPAKDARKMIGPERILGVSARTVEQALKAQDDGADYLGAGAVFSTSTKYDAQNISRETLKAICEAVSIPVVAIGGISQENICELAGTGIAGAAVVSAVFAEDDIEAAAGTLLNLVEKIRS